MRISVENELYNLVDCVAAQTGKTLESVLILIVRKVEKHGAIRLWESDSELNCSILPGTRVLKTNKADFPSNVTATEFRRSMAFWCLKALDLPVVKE
jgi:hypothetical protein